MDFGGWLKEFLSLVEFAYNNNYQSSIQMVSYGALYGRRCYTRVYWKKLGEAKILDLDLIRETKDNVKFIRVKLKKASDRKKFYSDLKRKDVEFDVGDKVFIMVLSWNKVLRFGYEGMLSPYFVGPFEILKKVGPVVYYLLLPQDMDEIQFISCFNAQEVPFRPFSYYVP